MDQNTQQLLRGRIDAFATDIAEILTRAVADAVTLSLGASGSKAAAGKRGLTSGSSGRSPVKVVPADLLRAVVQAGPDGVRMEQLGRVLNTPTKDLIRPIKALVAKKKVKRSGKARGTTYRAA